MKHEVYQADCLDWLKEQPAGSDTTLAVAKRFGRNAIGIDIRESQVKLTNRRLATVQPEMFA